MQMLFYCDIAIGTKNCPARRKTTNAREATPYKSVVGKEQDET